MNIKNIIKTLDKIEINFMENLEKYLEGLFDSIANSFDFIALLRLKYNKLPKIAIPEISQPKFSNFWELYLKTIS